MRAAGFLCFAGTEIANEARTFTYGRELTIPGATFSADCFCSMLDEGYIDPATDDAPWYEPTRSESADFFGLWAHSVVLPSPAIRATSGDSYYGSQLQPLRFSGQTIEVTGTMFARTSLAMAYGERWLREALRGSPCGEGGCPSDDLIYLPACPDDVDYPDGDQYFRTLVDVGLATPPIFAPINDLPECYLQEVSFALGSSRPWQYHDITRVVDEQAVYGDTVFASLTTPEWMGDGTFVIDVTATTDITNLVITGRVSLDGDCPVGFPGDSVMPCFTYTIPAMQMDDRIVIDGMRRKANYYDASDKFATSALPRMTWSGPFVWPDVSVCTTVCVTIEVETGDAVATVDTALREV